MIMPLVREVGERRGKLLEVEERDVSPQRPPQNDLDRCFTLTNLIFLSLWN